MKIYKENATSITLSGQTFTAVGDGIIDVPNYLAANAFSQGFVSAKAILRQLQEDAANATSQSGADAAQAQPQPKPEPAIEQPAAEPTSADPVPAKKK